MAQNTIKTKRRKLPYGEKDLISPHKNSPCPNLPNLIARQPILMKNITSFGCVIKSWRSPSKNCSSNTKIQWSQLTEINPKEKENARSRSHIIDIPYDEEYYFYHRNYKNYKARSYKETWYQGVCFKGHSHGRVVVTCQNSSSCYLWEPVKRRAGHLPNWDTNVPFKIATLSSQPKDHTFPLRRCKILSGQEDRIPCIAMVITGLSHPAFAFYDQKKEDNQWIYQDCNFKDPYNPNQNMRFCNAIGFKGKFYALSLQGSLVVLDQDVDSCFAIAAVGKNRAVPSRPSRQFREYLVECDGEILIVFLISRKCINVVDDVEVFKLDVFRLLLMKVENIEGRALFLEDECCMWVRSREVGCMSNCIYFTHHRVDDDGEWFVYEMSSGGISPASRDFMRWDEPIIEK